MDLHLLESHRLEHFLNGNFGSCINKETVFSLKRKRLFTWRNIFQLKNEDPFDYVKFANGNFLQDHHFGEKYPAFQLVLM